MSLFCWTQRKIFWRMWETEQLWGTIDFHSIFFSYYGSQWCPKTAWLQTFFKISSFVFGRTKIFIQVWNYLRVSKWWQNFHFWVNYPFNAICDRVQLLTLTKACNGFLIRAIFFWFHFHFQTRSARRGEDGKGCPPLTLALEQYRTVFCVNSLFYRFYFDKHDTICYSINITRKEFVTLLKHGMKYSEWVW